jgi:predicted GIY-YIG superfamily endonuclease
MKNLIFYIHCKKESTALAPEQAFYKLFRNQKNLDYTTTDLLLLWQM